MNVENPPPRIFDGKTHPEDENQQRFPGYQQPSHHHGPVPVLMQPVAQGAVVGAIVDPHTGAPAGAIPGVNSSHDQWLTPSLVFFGLGFCCAPAWICGAGMGLTRNCGGVPPGTPQATRELAWGFASLIALILVTVLIVVMVVAVFDFANKVQEIIPDCVENGSCEFCCLDEQCNNFAPCEEYGYEYGTAAVDE